MLGTQLAQLLDGVAPGHDEALDLVVGFDDALANGFARLTDERAGALLALAGAVATTPLRDRVGEAAEKVVAGSVADEHLAALAGARTALLGAVHDALLARADAALGRTRLSWETPPVSILDDRLSGCRSWLRELAIAGWRGVDHDLVSTAGQVLQTLFAEPRLRRLAVLVDGLAAELRASSPVGTMERLPVRRWGDLWSRALLLSQVGGLPDTRPAAEPVSGRLLILGVDVHEHSTAVQVQVHGLLETAGTLPRLVRTSVAVAKVDTIVGTAVWRLLSAYPMLLTALAEHRSLDVTDLPLLGSGDLIWHDDRARPGGVADPFATARIQLATALAPAAPPLDRHPTRIAEPVLLEGYTTAVQHDAITLELGGNAIAVDVERLPSCGPLTAKLVADSSACLGLLRWDGGQWLLQPVAVQATVKKKTVTVHTGDWAMGPTDPKVAKAEGDAVAVLRERAGRLLRR